MRGGKATHVLLPVAEYERILDQLEARVLERILDEPGTRWIPASDAALRLAGESLADARRRAGLTQKQLAERLDMPQSQISRIERNPDRTTVRTLRRVAAALGLDIGSMLKFAR
jgi:DNA-binding XRE family transcriptional regulator